MPKILEPILTPQDAAWGRQVNDRLNDHETALNRFSLEQVATNKGVAGSVSSLSEQIRDLTGRVSYTVTDGTSSTWTATQAPNTAWGPTLTFTLTEGRTVSLEFIASGHVSVSTVGTSSGYTSIKPMLFINSGAIGPDQPRLEVVLRGNGTEIAGPLSARVVADLPAGTHVLQGGFAWRQVVTTSGSGLLGIIDAANPQLFVDVLQTTGA